MLLHLDLSGHFDGGCDITGIPYTNFTHVTLPRCFNFVLCLKVACDMGYTGEEGDERLQLVSFHSTSKVTFPAHFRVKRL